MTDEDELAGLIGEIMQPGSMAIENTRKATKALLEAVKLLAERVKKLEQRVDALEEQKRREGA